MVDYANGTTPSGFITFNDPDSTDRPTASVDRDQQTVTFTDAAGHVQTNILSGPLIAALEAGFTIAEPGNTNTGRVDWTYAVPDSSLDFLRKGETITVTSPIIIDDHNGGTVPHQNVVVTINGEEELATSPQFSPVASSQLTQSPYSSVVKIWVHFSGDGPIPSSGTLSACPHGKRHGYRFKDDFDSSSYLSGWFRSDRSYLGPGPC